MLRAHHFSKGLNGLRSKETQFKVNKVKVTFPVIQLVLSRLHR